jgi:hypothetical protein
MGIKYIFNPTTGSLDAVSVETPAGADTEIQFNNAGVFGADSDLTWDDTGKVLGVGGDITLDGRFISSLNGALSATGIAGVPVAATGTWITGGTATTTKPQVLIEPTGTTSTAWSTNGTGLGVNAASGFAGRLLDLQVNGTSWLGVEGGGVTALSVPTNLQFNVAGLASVSFPNTSNRSLRVRHTADIGWCQGGNLDDPSDLTLFRDAADTLAQRRTTNAQTSRVYGTYTDASNYVRVALSSTSTAVTLAAETAGTGADDIPLNLTAAGTGTIKVNSVAEVVVSSTVAGLPAAPVVGMLTRVTDATAPAVGSTVTGGGAAAALCWYNGANWSVIGV